MFEIASASIKAAARITATNNGAGVDITAFQGLGKFLLNSSNTEGADNTSNAKLQHSNDNGSTDAWTDVSGGAFAQVANGAASAQELMLNVDSLKKWVRVVNTLAGTTPAVTASVTLIGKKQIG